MMERRRDSALLRVLYPVRAAFGLGLGFAHLLTGVVWVNIALLASPALGRRAAACWCRGLLHLIGVRIHCSGRPVPGALLVVNHLSWVDIALLYGMLPETFLSKEEVQAWPMVGRIARRLGTLFIGRGQSGAADRAAGEMSERLRAGERVIFFPEGRIGAGGGVLPFRARLLRAAHEAETVVQPVAVSYQWGDRDSAREPLGAMVPERSVLASAWWVAGRSLTAHVRFLDPLASSSRSRRALAEDAREAIVTTLHDQPSLPSEVPPR